MKDLFNILPIAGIIDVNTAFSILLFDEATIGN